jgi:hypothetical protein
MKSVSSPGTSLSKRFGVSLTLCTALAALPLSSMFHSAQAKPKSGAPAYGYRAQSDSKAQKRADKRRRRQPSRDWRTSRRNDRNTARPNRRNERFDDRRHNDRDYNDRDHNDHDYNDRRSDNRDYVTRYRTVTNSAGERVRQYFRVYR